MKKMTLLLAAAVFGLLLAGCGGGEEQGSEKDAGGDGVSDSEAVVGGFVVTGPEGVEIAIPEVTVDREAVENYLQTVRPVLEDTSRDLSRLVVPNAELEDQTLTFSVEIESIEGADAAVEQGLEALQQVQPPEGLEPVHEELVRAYEEAIPAYDNLLEAFDSGDIGQLAGAAQESLPEIEQFSAEARAILQELERVATVNPDDRIESRG